MCNKTVTYENKEYTITARAEKQCKPNELRVGDTCVTESQQYFEQP